MFFQRVQRRGNLSHEIKEMLQEPELGSRVTKQFVHSGVLLIKCCWDKKEERTSENLTLKEEKESNDVYMFCSRKSLTASSIWLLKA